MNHPPDHEPPAPQDLPRVGAQALHRTGLAAEARARIAAADAAEPADAVRHASRLAARDVAPLAASVLQFAVAIGATIAASDVDPVAALAGSAILTAGSAQLASIDLVDAGASVAVAVGTAMLINARFVLYGASFAQWFAGEPRWRRYLLVFPIVDQTYILCSRRFADHTDLDWRRCYYLVVVAGLFGAFLAGQLIGYAVGDLVPESAGLHLAAPLVFAGLLATATTSRSSVVAGVVAAGTFAVTAPVFGGLGLLLAALAGMLAGSRSSRSRRGV